MIVSDIVMWSSMIGLVTSGSSARYMSRSRSVPLTAAMRIPMPRIRASPMPSRPTMKSTSMNAFPARPLKKPENVPSRFDRKPVVGLFPLIHDRSAGVANPSPNVLSRKAQRK
ncbi:Uncharacterised protein [Mycobacteroides abscessus]|nr:Uncharacterised protein [Mycobacteroides abscessus]